MVEIRKFAKSQDVVCRVEAFGVVNLATHIPRNRKERRILAKLRKETDAKSK